jgi:glycosyltransferase involved in cell wall biosynthesis
VSPKRILIVNDYGYINGGVEAFQREYRRELESRGYSVRVFTSSATLRGRHGEGTPLADSTCYGTTWRTRTLLQTANPSAYFGLRRELSEFQPDIVHLNDFLTQLSPLILPALQERPTVHYVQWHRVTCPSGTRYLPDDGICNVSAGIACLRNRCLPIQDWIPMMGQMQMWDRWKGAVSQFVSASVTMQSMLERFGLGHSTIIPLAVRVGGQVRRFSERPSAMYAGRLVREKGVAWLLRAFDQVRREIPEARLNILGDGPEAAALKALAAELDLGNHVGFAGWAPPERLQEDFADCWVQVAPSVWEEPFGMVALEAGARATPIIVSNVGGLAEIVVEGVTGRQVRPNDITGLAQALIEILSSKPLAMSLGEQARERIRTNYSLDDRVNEWCQLYERIA